MNTSRFFVTRRFWGGVATGALLLVAAALLGRPLLFGGAAVVFGWLLLQLGRFVVRVRRVRSSAAVDQQPAGTRLTVDRPVPIAVAVRLPVPVVADVTVDVETPMAAVKTTDGPAVTLRAGDREGTGDAELVWDVAGSYRLAAPRVTLRDPAGLFVAELTLGNEPTVVVDPPHVGRVHLGRTGRELVEDAEQTLSLRYQSGVEPERIREHMEGDSMRHIDWRATARIGTLHIREFDKEPDRSAGLVIDTRRSMADGPVGRTKLDYVRHLALSVREFARTQRLPVGLFVCDEVGPVLQVPAQVAEARSDVVWRQIHRLHPGPGPANSAGSGSSRYSVGRVRAQRSPVTVSRTAHALDGDESPFATRLRPFFARGERPSRIGLAAADPLYETVSAFRARHPGPAVTYVFTDDTHRDTLSESVRAAAHNDGEVVVFLTPSVLFDTAVLANPDVAYDQFVEFERFRQTLDAHERVTVYEVGPGDELATLLSRVPRRRRRRRRGRPGSGTTASALTREQPPERAVTADGGEAPASSTATTERTE